MLYADYKYYTQTYHGRMTEEEFLRLLRPASAYLDRLTINRITADMADRESTKDACCAVAEALLLNENGGGIASETNDGISVNYVAGVSNTKTDGQRLQEAAALYLPAELLYRGVK